MFLIWPKKRQPFIVVASRQPNPVCHWVPEGIGGGPRHLDLLVPDDHAREVEGRVEAPGLQELNERELAAGTGTGHAPGGGSGGLWR